MPRGIDMGHDMDRPAPRERFVGIAAGIHRHRIETAADTGIGAEQRDWAEQPLGLLDDVLNVLFLGHVAFECGAVDIMRNRSRGRAVDIDHHHLGGTRTVKGLAQRLADAIGAAGDNHDLAGHLHRHLPILLVR